MDDGWNFRVLALAVIEQAVIDYRVTLEAGLVDADGKFRPGRVARAKRLPTMMEPEDIKSLRPFLFRGGVEVWIKGCELRVNGASIRRGLRHQEKNFKRSCHEGYLTNEQQGNVPPPGPSGSNHQDVTGPIDYETQSLLLREATPLREIAHNATLEAFLKGQVESTHKEDNNAS